MLANQEKPKTEREMVIQASNLGIAFETKYQRDDYKSKVMDFLKKDESQKNKKVWPLRGIDFTGYKGEILGVVGSNGSGKTTLCKAITGILKADEGDLYVDGKVTALFSLGMGFRKELTGRENVYLNGMMIGISKDKINEYINEIHEFSGIGKFFDQPMKYYSSGMKARLGFSVASHLEPEILILDEALNTGDIAFGRKAAAKMKELVAKAKMVILVTHSLRYARNHCDRLIWLEKGEIRAIGEPGEIIDQYRATLPVKKPNRRRFEINKTEANVKDNIVVKAEDVSVSYNLNGKEFWAVRNLDFEIKEGEVVGIIGHNGAGKSTMCKLLTNILVPEEGKLTVNGETTALLGYGAGFNEQLSGSDNIYLNGMLLGIPRKKVETDYPKIVEFAELEKVIDRPIKRYSAGMKSRLGFSIAATLQPDIFIIDEGLSTGDIAFQQKASEKIQDMMDQAKAVIIVSHSMQMVKQLCTKVIWMDRGQIKFIGDPDEGVRLYREHVAPKKPGQGGVGNKVGAQGGMGNKAGAQGVGNKAGVLGGAGNKPGNGAGNKVGAQGGTGNKAGAQGGVGNKPGAQGKMGNAAGNGKQAGSGNRVGAGNQQGVNKQAGTGNQVGAGKQAGAGNQAGNVNRNNAQSKPGNKPNPAANQPNTQSPTQQKQNTQQAEASRPNQAIHVDTSPVGPNSDPARQNDSN